MAAIIRPTFSKTKTSLYNVTLCVQNRMIQTTPVCSKVQSGRYLGTPKKNFPLTFEQALKPFHIGSRKAWNSWNTSAINGGLYESEFAVEDMFIRKFVTGTFTSCVSSEIIIKRQYNMIRIAFVLVPKMAEEKILFLIGYCQEILSYWVQGPVKLEVQAINDPKKMIVKYV